MDRFGVVIGHMIPARILTTFALFCGLFLLGCQSPPSVGEITVTVVEVKTLGHRLNEPQVIITLRFINENVVPVALEGSTHKLYLNGTFVGEAINLEAIGLAPTSAHTRDVSISFENPALVQQLAASGNSHVSYRLKSMLEYLREDEKEYLKSETNGTVDLSQLTVR